MRTIVVKVNPARLQLGWQLARLHKLGEDAQELLHIGVNVAQCRVVNHAVALRSVRAIHFKSRMPACLWDYTAICTPAPHLFRLWLPPHRVDKLDV